MPAKAPAARIRPERNARERILDTASDLFYRHGFRAVGVDTIIAESGVAKMSLYRHFKTKDDLVVAYLERANEKFWEWFTKAQGTGSARRRLVRLFEQTGKLVGSPSCFGCTFQHAATDFPSLEHPAHEIANRHKQRVLAELQRLVAEAGLRRPSALAAQLLLLMDGAFVAARMFGPSNHAVSVRQAAKTLIDAHSGPRSRSSS